MLSSEWTKKLQTEEEKADLEKTVRNASYVLSHLLEMIQEREQLLARQEIKQDTYNNPSWAFFQADNNGARRENLYIQRWLKEIVDNRS